MLMLRIVIFVFAGICIIFGFYSIVVSKSNALAAASFVFSVVAFFFGLVPNSSDLNRNSPASSAETFSASESQASLANSTSKQEQYDRALKHFNEGEYLSAINELNQMDGLNEDSKILLDKSVDKYCDNIISDADSYWKGNDIGNALKIIKAAQSEVSSARLDEYYVEMVNGYLNTSLSLVNEHLSYQDFESALKDLDSALVYIPGNDELSSAKITVSAQYKAYLFDKAQATYEEYGHIEAMNVLQEGLSIITNENIKQEISNEINRYRGLTPDAISSFKVVESTYNGIKVFAGGTDNYGNTYNESFCSKNNGNIMMSPGSSATIHLKKEYSRISGVLYFPEKLTEGQLSSPGIMRLYADDVLIYTSPEITNRSEPERFDVAVTECNYLEIVLRGDYQEKFDYIWISNTIPYVGNCHLHK